MKPFNKIGKFKGSVFQPLLFPQPGSLFNTCIYKCTHTHTHTYTHQGFILHHLISGARASAFFESSRPPLKPGLRTSVLRWKESIMWEGTLHLPPNQDSVAYAKESSRYIDNIKLYRPLSVWVLCILPHWLQHSTHSRNKNGYVVVTER